MASSKSRTRRNLFYGIGALLATGLLVAWVIHPGYLLLNLPKLDPKEKSVMPSPDLLKLLDAYHKIRSAGPVYRPYIRQRAAAVISQKINPTQIERSYRTLLLKGSMGDWSRRYSEWEKILLRLETQFPHLHLDAYRAFLYLRSGHLERLRLWGQRFPDEPPEHRLTLLRRVWFGHACFFGGWPKEALRHYKLALQGYNENPAWDTRTPSNWRLPAELTTVLYHLSLLNMRNKQYAMAYKHLQRMKLRLLQIRPKAHKLPLWLLIHAWSALACQRQERWACAREHHKLARKYSDPTMSLLMESAQDSRRNNDALYKVIATHREHVHSYPDSRNLARLKLALTLYQAGQSTNARKVMGAILRDLRNRNWTPTLSMFQRRNTYIIRFLPVPPSVWASLYRAIKNSPAPTKASKKAPTPRSKPNPRNSASQPTSAPSTKPAKVQAKKATAPQPEQANSAQMLREVRLYQAFSHLKLFQWKAAQTLLQQLRNEAPQDKSPLIYLGMIALQQGQFQQAYQHFKSYYQTNSSKQILLYTTYAAVRAKAADVTSWLSKLSSSKIRKSVVQRILAMHQNKPLPKNTNKAQFWWRILGPQGLLTIYDPHLHRSSYVWRILPALQTKKLPKQMLRSMSVSHHVTRHSLNSWLGRYYHLAQLFPHKREEYLRRLSYIRSYYLAFPELWYALDRVMYSKQWGLMALGLY